MDWLIPFLKDGVVMLAKLGDFLTSPILEVPNLPAWATSPLAIFSLAGLTLVLVMNLISLLNPLN